MITDYGKILGDLQGELLEVTKFINFVCENSFVQKLDLLNLVDNYRLKKESRLNNFNTSVKVFIKKSEGFDLESTLIPAITSYEKTIWEDIHVVVIPSANLEKIDDEDHDVYYLDFNFIDKNQDFCLTDVSYETALGMAKSGHRISRSGWNGKGMYVVDFSPVSHGMEIFRVYDCSTGTELPLKKFLMMKTADNMWIPWLASNDDQQQNDWCVHHRR